MVLRLKLLAANKPCLANILLYLVSHKRGTIKTKTTLGPAAQTSYIYDKLYIWSLVAYQRYRNLGLCWSVSNQRFLSLPEREGMCTSLQFQRTATNVDGFILIIERNSTEMATMIQKHFSPFWKKSLKHYRTPTCISLQVSTWLYRLSFSPSLFRVWKFSPPPKEMLSSSRDIFISPTALDTVLNSQEALAMPRL